MNMNKLINMGTLLNRVEELEEKVKHLEEHYNFELRKDIENDVNQLEIKFPYGDDVLETQTDKPCDCEDFPCCGHAAIKSPLQDWN